MDKRQLLNSSFRDLRRAARASLRGDSIEPRYLYETALRLLREFSLDDEDCRDFARTMFLVGRALNDVGEYAFASEVFEFMLKHSPDTKSQFESLEGLAIARFYMGEKTRAFATLTLGLELAVRAKRKKMTAKFECLVAELENGNPKFPKVIKAPGANPHARTKKRAHASTMLKKGK